MRIVQRPMSCENAAIKPSTTAVHSAILMRRSPSRRPIRVLPASIIGWLYATKSTVPRWCREPRAPFGGNPFPCSARLVAVEEQSVDRRPRPRDVGAKRSQLQQLLRDRRRREVVRRQCCQVARAPHTLEGFQKRGVPCFEPLLAVAGVERRIDVARRRLPCALRQHHEDPVVLRQLYRV